MQPGMAVLAGEKPASVSCAMRTEESGKREMMGVTPRSPPAAADSLTRQSVYIERHDAIG